MTRRFADPLCSFISHLSFYAGLWGFERNPFFYCEKSWKECNFVLTYSYEYVIIIRGREIERSETMRKESLPTGKYENGELILNSPYDWTKEIICTPYGTMNDGTMVWEDENGKQYTRNRFYGKYYFIEL